MVSESQRHPNRAGEAAVEEADPGTSAARTDTSTEAGRMIAPPDTLIYVVPRLKPGSVTTANRERARAAVKREAEEDWGR